MSRYVILIFSMLSLSVISQEKWSLEKCIQYAIENNLEVKSSQLNMQLQEEQVTRDSYGRLPSVNGFASNVYNFGQTIDPFTNQFAQDRVRSNQFGVSANMTLFNGLQQYNNNQSSQLELQALRYDLEQAKNDISLAVANAYLNVLSNDELLRTAQNQLAQTKRQLSLTQKLFSAGTIPKGDVLEIEAQLATEEFNVVSAKNQVDLSLLQLQQILQLPYDQNFTIEKPELNIVAEGLSLNSENVYNRSLEYLPQMKSAELRKERAEKEVSIAKGGLSPRLNLNASIGTGYSGRNEEITDFATETIVVGTTASGEAVTRQISSPTASEVKPFSTQLDENFNQSVGITLNVPIFNGLANKTNISQAKITQEIRDIQYEQVKNQIRIDVQNAYANALANKNNFVALEKSVQSQREAFKYTEKQFEVGVINAVDYNNSKTLLTNAEANLIRAKYNYLFSLKILDFYQGKPITLD